MTEIVALAGRLQRAGPLPTLAKLTRPRLFWAVPRERLFTQLDEARQLPAVCVVGPPGAGKTTLVASYLDTRGLPGIWYQVDAGDVDIATFFYYLGLAAAPYSRKDHHPLPVLTPEYLQDVLGFTRRFFRELFARLPASASLVLDNYQDVPPESSFHEVVSLAASEVPEGSCLIVVSRSDPPTHYARLIANERVTLLEWDDLRLTLEETDAIAAARCDLDKDTVRSLHERSGGWAAGLTLLLERQRRSIGDDGPTQTATLDGIFDYFAGEIFQRAPLEVQRFLVATSFLPRITLSIATELTENRQAEQILESLYKRHLFIHRRPGAEPTYQYHALFQAFLQSRAGELLGLDGNQAMQLRAARLLEGVGLPDDAFSLYRRTESWSAARELVLRQARPLLTQGRGQTLRDWIAALPGELISAEPWLLYWLGVSLISIDQRQAREHLELAFERFGEQAGTLGQALSASGVIQTIYFEWSDFRLHRRWIEVLDELLPQEPPFDSAETELEVYSSLLVAMLHGQPGHPMLSACSSRVMALLDADLELNARIRGATFLLSYCTLANRLDMGRRLITRMGPLVIAPAVTPLNQVWWFGRLGYFFFQEAASGKAIEALNRAHEISEQHGLAGLRSGYLLFLDYRVTIELGRGELQAAAECLERIERLANPGRRMDLWHVKCTRLKYALARADVEFVLENGPALVEQAVSTGMPYVEMLSLFLTGCGYAHRGLRPELEELLQRLRSLTTGTCFTYLEAETRLLETYFLLLHGDRDHARQALRDALAMARSERYFYYCRLAGWMLSTLFAEALSAGIEVEYVRDSILHYAVPPPLMEVEAWPWPVKVFTLGRFQIFVNGKGVEFAGKAPRKPLALLKTIVAFGGQGVSQQTVLDTLWPDEDGDAAHRALSVALLRLRRLLGNTSAVLLSDQKLALNPQLVWVDASAFQRFVENAEVELPAAEAGRIAELADQTISLYRGNFLPEEQAESWSITPRLRLRGRFARFVETVGRRLESTKRWDRAIVCYQRGIEIDDLAEEFYIGLMRCYLKLNRAADGLAVFRRLRQTLSIVLGLAPSPPAEELARALREQNQNA